MGKIFLIMGKSSTGKDSIFSRLLNNKSLELIKVVSYTTRPIRENEENGREYFFCNIEDKNRYFKENKIIEIRTYNTWHGDWDYFTVDDGQIDLKKGNYLMIGTLESFDKLRKYYSKDNVIPIYIEVEDGVRLKRALEREGLQKIPKYEELCRRFLSDQEDFADDKLKSAGIEKKFDNEEIEKTVLDISNYILKEIK